MGMSRWICCKDWKGENFWANGSKMFVMQLEYSLLWVQNAFESIGKVALEDGEYYDYDDDANESISVTQIRNGLFLSIR